MVPDLYTTCTNSLSPSSGLNALLSPSSLVPTFAYTHLNPCLDSSLELGYPCLEGVETEWCYKENSDFLSFLSSERPRKNIQDDDITSLSILSCEKLAPEPVLDIPSVKVLLSALKNLHVPTHCLTTL